MRRVVLFALGASALAVLSWTCASIPAAAKDKSPEGAGAEKEFLALYGSDDPAERAKAIDGLRAAPDAVKLQILSTRVVPKEKRADVVAHAVEVLSKVTDEATAEKIAALAVRSGPADQRCAYIEAMAGLRGSGAAHASLLSLLKDKDTWVRAMACWSLGEHKASDALEPLVACLQDRTWQVQTAAMAALPRLTDKEALRAKAVPVLIEALDLTAGRIRDDCADALRKITGQNLGKLAEPWRKWLATGETPKAEGTAPKGDGGAEGPYANQPAETPHFYGIEVTSTRVVLVLDVSMSMNDGIDIDKDRLRRETSRRAVTGEGTPKEGEKAAQEDTGYDIPWWKIHTKFDLAKYQTINLISRLREEQNFELILFSTDVKPWMSRLVPAHQANKQKAIQLLESINFDDKTNTWGGLSAAFEMSASSVRTGGANCPDEIYLVTDGEPSIGDIVDKEQLADAVLQLAKVHQMRVNVIAIGINLRFLRKMAVGTGGQYKSF